MARCRTTGKELFMHVPIIVDLPTGSFILFFVQASVSDGCETETETKLAYSCFFFFDAT